MGQIYHEVQKVVDNPDKIYLANQINGHFITPTDILNILRIIQGRGI
jgi:2-oxoglutarate ferredoxin oxidoreductase subunit alpha